VKINACVFATVAFALALAFLAVRAGAQDASIEALLYEPEHGDVCRIDGTNTYSGADNRFEIAFGLNDAIASMSSEDVTLYIAGKKRAPVVVEAWVWQEAARQSPQPDEQATPAQEQGDETPVHPDSVRSDQWAPSEQTYEPIHVRPVVLRAHDGHTMSAWSVDQSAQSETFSERNATNAIIGGCAWISHERVTPLPPTRDERGHTHSRYATDAPPTPAEADAIVRAWGRETLGAHRLVLGPKPPRTALEVLTQAMRLDR
jgi:hypothetical protein